MTAPILNVKISREQAIDIAKKAVMIPEGYKGPEISASREYGERVIWRVSWQQKKEPNGRICVAVDGETGMIVSLTMNTDDSPRPVFPPKVTYNQAVDIATEWVGKLYPHLSSQFVHVDEEVQSLPAESEYGVHFMRVVNGVPFPSHKILVNIDGNGELRHLEYGPVIPSLNFDSTEGVKPVDEMMAGIWEQMEMKLVYTLKGDDKIASPAEREWTLAYVPAFPYTDWDAKSGKPVSYYAQPLTVTPESGKPLAEQPQGAKPPVRERELTEKEALEQLQRFLTFPEGVSVADWEQEVDHHLSDHPVWRFSLEYRTNHSAVRWSGAAVDALTGEVLEVDFTPVEYKREEEQVNAAHPVSREQAREKALAFVTERLKPLLHELCEMPSDSEEELYHRFHFERRANGITVLPDNVSVTVSKRTGEILEFHRTWHDLSDLPEPADVIDPNEAKNTWFEGAKLKLEYRLTDSEWGLIEQNQSQADAKLVYTLELSWAGSIYIDARSGTPVNRITGERAVRKGGKQAEEPADIRGHRAETELSYFSKTGVLDLIDGKVMPEQEVKRGEFLWMLARMEVPRDVAEEFVGNLAERTSPFYQDVPPDHPDYGVIQCAGKQGWLNRERKTFEPDRPITREEAVEILVHMLGYSKVAYVHEIYRLPYQDADQIRLKGHVALAMAIGLVSKENRDFNPAAPLTRADAAIMLYRYLSKRGEYKR